MTLELGDGNDLAGELDRCAGSTLRRGVRPPGGVRACGVPRRRPPGTYIPRRKAIKRPNVVELRHSLADVLNRAEYQGERIVIHRRGKDAAAIIPIKDLQLLDA